MSKVSIHPAALHPCPERNEEVGGSVSPRLSVLLKNLTLPVNLLRLLLFLLFRLFLLLDDGH